MGEQTTSIPASVLSAYPALSPVSVGRMVELPCCGSRVDAEAVDCSVDDPNRLYWPPRWTCLECELTFTVNLAGSDLIELGTIEMPVRVA